MTISKRLLVFLLVLSLPILATAAVDPQPADPDLPNPSVDLQPGDVVRIVIDALARNDQPYADAGIETTYRFAAPSNKVNTGPLERFTRMVKGPVYGIMVGHIGSEFSEVVLTGDKAYQLVRLVGGGGQTVVFAFRLGRQQQGEFENMWMTEAVWPVAVGEEAGQAF
jgi:hypothetical protein